MTNARPKIGLTDAMLAQLSAPKQHKWNYGSAGSLRGRIYLLSCFVSDPESDWLLGEKCEVSKKLQEAIRWIQREAARYDYYPEFECGTYGLEDDIVLKRIERYVDGSKLELDWIPLVLKAVGYDSPTAFHQRLKEEAHCDSACVLIFAKGTGRSFALPSYKGNARRDLVEGTVLYERYLSGTPLLPSSIAHEIMHLFGAWDFYEAYNQKADRSAKARQLFPKSIMLHVPHNINDAVVDEVTAWLIGWNHAKQPWYEWFCPEDSR